MTGPPPAPLEGFFNQIFRGGWAAAIAPGKSAAAPDAAAACTIRLDRLRAPLLPPLKTLYRRGDSSGLDRDVLHAIPATVLLPLSTGTLQSTTGWRAPAHDARSAIAATSSHCCCTGGLTGDAPSDRPTLLHPQGLWS